MVTFTIGQDKIQPALDQAFNKVKKNLNAPGFRKGHMPRAVFNQKFGEEALYDDALNAILPAAYEAAIAELGLDVVAQPKIDVKSIEKGQDWTLTAEVVTKPEVKLGAYKDLEVSVEASKEVTDEEVDAKLENERKNLADWSLKKVQLKWRHCCYRLCWFSRVVLNLTVVKVKTTLLNLVQVNLSQDSKTNWLEQKLVMK